MFAIKRYLTVLLMVYPKLNKNWVQKRQRAIILLSMVIILTRQSS